MKLVLFSLRAELTREWMSAQLRDQRLDPGQTILYSYWFDHAAAGLALLKEQFPQVRVVSRAHGFDIFEEHYFPYYWPRRRETLAALDRLFLASEAGRRYFMDRYPEFASKYETAHLGTRKPGMIASPSNDNVFRIVSCSNIVPIKRLDLLVDGIASAARLRADQQFDWTHIGDGAGRQVLERHMRRTLPANARGNLLGFLPNTEILRLYGEQPWDVFINVSKSEGGAPLAIQEAISCGMPVIAASVGGNPEIVSDGNGILLSPTPSPAEIAGALLRLRDNPSLAASLRTGSRQVWKQRFDAEVNFRSFAGKLANLSVRQEIGASP